MTGKSEARLAEVTSGLAVPSVLRADLDTGRGDFDSARAQLNSARAIAGQYQFMSELVLCCGLGDLEALQMLAIEAVQSNRESNK